MRKSKRCKKSERLLKAALIGTVWASTALGAQCPTTLAYLEQRLPRYNDAQLEQMRTLVLQTNVVEAMTRARAQGATPAQAAAAALDLAEKSKSQLVTAASCVHQTSTDPEKTLADLQNGSFRFTGVETVMETCAKQYVMLYYMAVAAKETAIVAACLANNPS